MKLKVMKVRSKDLGVVEKLMCSLLLLSMCITNFEQCCNSHYGPRLKNK